MKELLYFLIKSILIFLSILVEYQFSFSQWSLTPASIDMKKYTLLILLFLLPFFLLSQTGDFEKPLVKENSLKSDLLLKDTSYKKNLWSIDVDFVALSIAYSKRIPKNNWRFGIGCGVGVNYFTLICLIEITTKANALDINKNDIWKTRIFEFYHGEFFLKKQYSDNMDLEYGFRIAKCEYLEKDDYEPNYGPLLSLYFSPLFGWKHFKVGPRINFSFLNSMLYIYPFTYKISF